MTTVAELLSGVSDLVGRRTLTAIEDSNWRFGTETGGPNNDGTYPFTAPDGSVHWRMSPAAVGALLTRGIGKSVRTPQQHMGSLATITDGVQAADGTWSGTNATPAIIATIEWCYANGGGTTFLPAGTYYIESDGEIIVPEARIRGVIPMRPGVKIESDGAVLVMSGGRHNPPSMFYHRYTRDVHVDNVRFDGLLTIDNNMAAQTWDQGDASGGAGDTDFQYQHCIEWLRGSNIEISRCIFKNTRGSGIAAGNPFQDAPDLDPSRTLIIHNSEFFNCYREAAIIPWSLGGSFHHNYVHGDGYLVAGLDLERHNKNERIEAFSVYGNTFDFRDGWGPIERRKVVRMRRAISAAFFYAGYPGNVDDGRFGKISIYDNTIYQGQIDAWGVGDISIYGNKIYIKDEDLVVYEADGVTPKMEYGVPMLVRYVSGEAIKCTNHALTQGLIGPSVYDNTVVSTMRTWGIRVTNYFGATISRNKVYRTKKSAIYAEYSSGTISNNYVEDVGTRTSRVAAISVGGNRGMLTINTNDGVDTRPFADADGVDQRGMTCVVDVIAPLGSTINAFLNSGTNLIMVGDSVKPYPGQNGAITGFGNTNGDPTLRCYGKMIVGTGTGLAGLMLDGGVGENKQIQFNEAGVPKVTAGLFGDDNDFAVYYQDEAGGFGGNFMKGYRATGDLDVNSGRLRVKGTWQKPVTLADVARLWCDPDTGILYTKVTDPSGPTDGTPLNS